MEEQEDRKIFMAKGDSRLSEIEEYNKKLLNNPESLVFVPLAEAYRKSGMQDEAIETCLKGLQLHPAYMSARMVLGRAYMEKAMFEEAAAEFRKMASSDTNNIMAHTLLGQLYMQQEQFANAIEAYQKVLSLNPEDDNVQQKLNQALELARQDNSRPRKDAGAQTRPEPEASNKKEDISKAEELSKQGDIENALKIYRLILEADPENMVVRQRLKDIEIRKAQVVTRQIKAESIAPEPSAFYRDRDNDKITSDDILSVMKEAGIPEKPKGAPKAAPKAAPPPAAKPVLKASPPAVSPAAVKRESGQAAAPKPEGVKKAPPGPGGGDKILNALKKLVQTEGVLGGMLMDSQANVLASLLKTKIDQKEVAKIVFLIFKNTEKSVNAINYGKDIRQILITGEKGQIVFNKVKDRILLMLADNNINIGKMRLAINEIVKEIR